MAAPQRKIALYSIRIDCEGCVKKIQKVLKKARGVDFYTINKNAHTLQVVGQIDAEAILKKLRKNNKGKTVTLLEVKEEQRKEEYKREENNEEEEEEASRSSSPSPVRVAMDNYSHHRAVPAAMDNYSHHHAVPAAYQQNPAAYQQHPVAYQQNPAAYHQNPAAYQQNPDIYRLNDEQITMFSDENPNACSIM